MSVFHPGEIWKLCTDHELRRVRVLAAAGIPGWWRCVDLATDVYVLARESSLVERECRARSVIRERSMIPGPAVGWAVPGNSRLARSLRQRFGG
jgi:hypothetical protein